MGRPVSNPLRRGDGIALLLEVALAMLLMVAAAMLLEPKQVHTKHTPSGVQ